MRFDLFCPSCGDHSVDYDDYKSIILLAPNLALMQFTCPGCGLLLSAMIKLSPELQRSIQQRLNEADHTTKASSKVDSLVTPLDPSLLSFSSNLVVDEGVFDKEISRPLMSYAQDIKKELEEFRQKLDAIETVDEALKEIGSGFNHESRDV